ncbi:MAG: SH3 domain-containing protein [Gammaproteobacteria bacterium]|nr:SH3 domain-containing protein [Gammaproteobacteria bacterium]
MRFRILLLTFVFCWIQPATGSEPVQKVKVIEPFISIHTGPGKGYPIFHDLPRGNWISVLKQQTSWFKVKTDKGQEGWVHRRELIKTVTPDGEKFVLPGYTQDDFFKRNWEVGTQWGSAEGADVFNVYGAYALNPVISTEFSLSQMIGSLSVSTLIDIKLLAQPFPEWRVSPFFSLGTGTIKTRTRSSLVRQKDQEDNTSHVGVGVRIYLSRSFFMRAEYKDYVIFSSSNDNEEISIWTVGVGSFF